MSRHAYLPLAASCLALLPLAPVHAQGTWQRELSGTLDGQPARVRVDLRRLEAWAEVGGQRYRGRAESHLGRSMLTFDLHDPSGRALAFHLDDRGELAKGAFVRGNRRASRWFPAAAQPERPALPSLRGTPLEQVAQIRAEEASHRAASAALLQEAQDETTRQVERLNQRLIDHPEREAEILTALERTLERHGALQTNLREALFDERAADPREVHGPERPSSNRALALRDFQARLAGVQPANSAERAALASLARDLAAQAARESEAYRSGEPEAIAASWGAPPAPLAAPRGPARATAAPVGPGLTDRLERTAPR